MTNEQKESLKRIKDICYYDNANNEVVNGCYITDDIKNLLQAFESQQETLKCIKEDLWEIREHLTKSNSEDVCTVAMIDSSLFFLNEEESNE